MFKVVWKSFKYNRKNFLSFFMSEILSVAVIFMLVYIQEALSQVPGIKTEALQFAYQSELRKQLRIIIPYIILIMILVTGYSVKAYINTRIWDYKLFQLLGIRKKNLKVMIGLEYVISGMLACGFGILFGLIGTKIIKEILHTRINARFVKGISMSRVYLVLILSCLIMTIGVYITLQILLDTRTNLGDKIFKIKESRIHSMISVIYFIVGILVISSGYLLVNNDPMMAYMALICILTGLIILMIFGTGFFMEKFSESKYYKKHILAWNDCYCYIKKHGFRMLMQILLGIILIFNTFLMLRGTIHDRYMGKSGCGKTTLLKTLGMIDKPTDGTIKFMGEDTSELYGDKLADIRNSKIGFIFQDFYLMDSLSVEENIMLPMIISKQNINKMIAEAKKYAEQFQIEHLLKKNPYELSGGEKQRVAICRALINNPDLILADEPTGNLDSKSGKIVIDALNKISSEYKKTIVMVTHDPQMASYCSRLILLKDGVILEDLKNSGDQEAFYQEILGKMKEL